MLPPRGGRTNQATLPLSPGPHDSALELGGGGGGTGMAPSLQAQSPPPRTPIFQASTVLPPLTLPLPPPFA